MRKTTTKKEDSKTAAKAAKPKAKRTSVAELRKEIDALKATNKKLLNDVGNLSAMYMNSLSEKSRTGAAQDRVAVIMATKRILAFLMQTYGFAFTDLVK